MVVNLMNAKENINVPLDCPAAKKPQQILATTPRQKRPKGKHRKPAGGGGSRGRSRSARESCQGELANQEVGALHFSGSSHSHQRYDTLPEAFSRTPHISMGLRVNSSDGLVFYVSGSLERSSSSSVMTLSVSNGHLLLLINGGKRKTSVRSHRKYNDGQWHTVFVKREGEKASLIVDGIDAQSKRVSGGEKNPLSRPLYIGGVPSALTSSLLSMPGPGGFVGCVKDLELNEESQASPSTSLGVVPCFQTTLQPGAYFSSQGGRMSIESLMLGRDLEVQLEVRPVSDSGLLLHAGTRAGQQLSLYLNQGAVTVTVNSGNGEFSTSFTPEESLCDGRWHSITIVKKSNVLQLHVDAASEHSVGPKQGRPSGAKEAVYLGGAPDGVDVPGLPDALPSFHGCVRRAVLNQRPAVLSKPLSVHGAVGTQGCPAM
uniref:Laminin G domain-containing protein n=1 Tax=Hucho hucho TaxID=62062 RepID=A0A4W5JD38_9TELE